MLMSSYFSRIESLNVACSTLHMPSHLIRAILTRLNGPPNRAPLFRYNIPQIARLWPAYVMWRGAFLTHLVIGVDSGGQPGHAPPNNYDGGGQNPFLPPNNQTRIFKFCLFKKINMKESRNRDNNTKRTEYILNERCQFCKKKLSMTKKKVVRNFEENRRELFKIFFLKVNLPKIFVSQYL